MASTCSSRRRPLTRGLARPPLQTLGLPSAGPPELPPTPGPGAAHRAGLGAQARLAQVDGEDGVGA